MMWRKKVKSIDKRVLAFIMIFLYYFVTRLYGISGHMNEYFDYDEGTYLMIARLINQGYLPYRDIYAVHPPLFYYMLALWLRIFGDNYVIGRLLSVFLGFLSLIVAYYIGKEVKNWKLGVAFTGLLAMDPLLIHVNPLVFHESSIELFTLLSLYYFVRYTKTKNPKYAYISLFWAGIGSTSKFTILPFAVALYLTIFFSLNQEIFEHVKNASKVLLNKKQVFIGLVSYILITLISMSAIFMWPSELVRKLMIVPGLHKIEVYGQIIPSAFLLAMWGVLTVYVFRISYVDKLIRFAIFSIKNLRSAILLALAFLLPKFIIEGALGVMISRDYIYQTYLAQGGRGFPIINLFMYIGDKFGHIYNNTLELMIANVPLILLIAVILLVWTLDLSSEPNPVSQHLRALFIVSFFVYFFISPTLPNDRFLISLWLVLYLLLLEFLSSVKFTKRQLYGILSIFVVFLLIADYGMVYQYPQGKLKFIWAVHSKEMRDELKEYILKNNLSNEKFYAVNPMNTYYLGLQTEPYYIDTFGLILLKDMNSSQIIKELSEDGIKYYILSTWIYYKWPKPVDKEFKNLTLTIHKTGQLLYAITSPNGEIMEIIKTNKNQDNIVYFRVFKTNLLINMNEKMIAQIKPSFGNISTVKMIKVSENMYLWEIKYNKNQTTIFHVYPSKDSLTITSPQLVRLTLEFPQYVPLLSTRLEKVHNCITPSNTTIIITGDDYDIIISGNMTKIKLSNKSTSFLMKFIKIKVRRYEHKNNQD
ncbi:glycosyltransferase family 39 protein [Thermococcus sp. SY098]|uniref:ArnT family glycosyltransferase n=1 Tax=Thermococcus sp. SY098 TaxID=3111325 RepID=UPI002D79AB66|nr:glycosyltransferase family 39 protein [Thermococcus sp. SY098]WRS53045.1 glycosyltransferase family 39 protein [Thermococcus sp. SY098]